MSTPSIKVYRYELDPNNVQETELKHHCKMARYAYNWGRGIIERWLDIPKEERPKPYPVNHKYLGKRWTPWVNSPEGISRLKALKIFNTSRRAVEGGLIDVATNYNIYFAELKKPPEQQRRRKLKKPKWRKWKPANESFHAYGNNLKVVDQKVYLPIVGWVRTKETTHMTERITSVTVKRETDRWFISLRCKSAAASPGVRPEAAVGAHLGLRTFLTLSNGAPRIDSPRPLYRALGRVRRLNKAVSRRHTPGRKPASQNYKKARTLLAKAHHRVRRIRREFLHDLTTRLAKTYRVIIIEDWRIDKMLEQKRFSRMIADAGWRIFWNMLAYKCAKFGSDLLVMNTGFPSSKKCSSCGNVKDDFPLWKLTYHCDVCGYEAEREDNAAKNLLQDGLGLVPAAS